MQFIIRRLGHVTPQLMTDAEIQTAPFASGQAGKTLQSAELKAQLQIRQR
jgi:hypothetical protein